MRRYLNLILIITFVVLLTGCGTNKTTTKDITTATQSNKEPLSTTKSVIEEKNIDEQLMYIKSRLKNADFSFNFSIEKSNTVSAASRKNINHEYLNEGTTTTSTVFDFDIEHNDTKYYNPNTFFQAEKQYIKEMSNDAINVVDYCLKNVSVIDSLITDGNNNLYYISYDYEKDIVSVYHENSTNKIKIDIYYDEQNLETIHMSSLYDNKVLENTDRPYDFEYYELYYTANNYYYFTYNYTVESENMDYYGISVAKKIDGEWIVFATEVDKNNVLFTKNGPYSGNGPDQAIDMSFLIERNGNFFQLVNRIVPTRDNEIIDFSTLTEALETDSVAILKRYVRGDWYMMDLLGYGLQVPIEKFSSIDKLHIEIDSEEEQLLNTSNTTHFMFIDENDYLLTIDNKKIINNLCYNPKYGIIRFIDNMGNIEFCDSNNTLVEIEESDYYDTVQLYLSNGTIYNDKLSSIILLDIFPFNNCWKDNISESLKLISEAYDAFGLTLTHDEVFDELVYVERYDDIYLNQYFNNVFGIDYSANSLMDFLSNLIQDITLNINEFDNVIKDKTATNIADIQKEIDGNEFLAQLEIESGDFTIDFDNLDIIISNMVINVDRSPILHKNEEYVLKLLANNSVISTSSFITYNDEKMVYTIDKTIDIPFENGDYTFKLLLYRKKSSGDYPVSNEYYIKLPNTQKTTVETDLITEIGGIYRYTFEINNNILNVEKLFIDKVGPTISTSLPINNGIVTMNANSTLYDLIYTLNFTDNYDIFLILDDFMVVIGNNEPINVNELRNTLLINGETYKFTLSDSSNNVGVLELIVNLS